MRLSRLVADANRRAAAGGDDDLRLGHHELRDLCDPKTEGDRDGEGEDSASGHDLQASAAWQSVVAKAADRHAGAPKGQAQGQREDADAWLTVSPALPSAPPPTSSTQPAMQDAAPSLHFPSPVSNAAPATGGGNEA